MSSIISDEPGNDLIVFEYSANNPTFAQNPERAEVQISKDGVNWISLGLTSPTTCQGTLDHAFDISGKLPWFRYVKVIDKTDRNARILNGACAPTSLFAFDGLSDGFDLDAVTCGQGTTFARQEVLAEEIQTTNNSPIYPNPVKDWLTIDLSNEKFATDDQVEIHIRDISGNALYKRIHTLQSGSTEIEVSDFRTGIYILHVRSSDGSSGFYKFLKD